MALIPAPLATIAMALQRLLQLTPGVVSWKP